MWNWASLQVLFLMCAASIYSKAEDGELTVHFPFGAFEIVFHDGSGTVIKKSATVKSLHVTTDIKYRYATTRVSAEYVNTYNSPVTANFHVTLPARAYISNFSMDVDGNVTYGVVKKKAEAKEIYDEAVAKGQSTGYIEVKHRFTNVYDVSVNIEPGKNVVFNLTYQELLQRSLGKYRHVIHLINKEIINNFVIEVFINEPQDIINVQIPKIMSDELESSKEETKEQEGATIKYIDSKNVYIRYNPSADEQKQFGGDGIEGLFKVYYDVDRKDNPNTVYAIDGYFVHFFAPDSQPTLPKNIVFMLDISGSMNLIKLDQLKLAMVTILNSLKPDVDNFLIGTFSFGVTWMNDGVFMPAVEKNIAAAISGVKMLSASGSTDINEALLRSIKKLNHIQSSERKSVIFFLTDGDPTSGVSNTDIIQTNVKEANTESISLFTLGFGNQANNQFLRQVATENGGFSRKIYEAADSQLQIEGLYNEIANILLKDIEITYLDEEVDSQTLTPTNFSSYFKGSEIVTTGRLASAYQEEVNLQITMTNVRGKETVLLKLDLHNLSSKTSNSPNLTNLDSLSEITRNTWVFLTLKKLFKEERTENNTEEITSLALKFGLVTPLTSMVVTQSKLVGRVQSEDISKVDPLPSYDPAGGAIFRNTGRVFHNFPAISVPRTNARKPVHNGSPFLSLHTDIFPRRKTTSPPRPQPTITTTTISHTNVTPVIHFIPGILLEPYGCNETVCLIKHRSCLTHRKVLLLADDQAFIYIYGHLMKPLDSNCMKSFKRIVIKKKRKVLAEITPTMMTKNKKKFSLDNKNDIILNVKKYLKLKIYIKTVDNGKALSVQFTVLQPLPNPKGILGKYLSDFTCQKFGPNVLLLENKNELFEKFTYVSANSDRNQCFMDST